MDVIREYWQQLLVLVAVTVWLIRLEAKVIFNAKDIKMLSSLRTEDLKRAETSRAETNKKIDDLKTSQERHFESLREDIRILITKDK